MPDRCTDPTCQEHWPDVCWVVSYDHWGQDGITIVAVCATEEAARKVVADEVTKLDYKIERWDVTR